MTDISPDAVSLRLQQLGADYVGRTVCRAAIERSVMSIHAIRPHAFLRASANPGRARGASRLALCLSALALPACDRPVSAEEMATPAVAARDSADGRGTALCGSPSPLPAGFVGTSPVGACECCSQDLTGRFRVVRPDPPGAVFASRPLHHLGGVAAPGGQWRGSGRPVGWRTARPRASPPRGVSGALRGAGGAAAGVREGGARGLRGLRGLCGVRNYAEALSQLGRGRTHGPLSEPEWLRIIPWPSEKGGRSLAGLRSGPACPSPPQANWRRPGVARAGRAAVLPGTELCDAAGEAPASMLRVWLVQLDVLRIIPGSA